MTTVAERLDVTVTSVRIASPAAVEFLLTNEDGVRLAGLTPGNLHVGLARLVPGESDRPDRWESYIQVTEIPPPPGPAPRDWPGTTAQPQAATDSGGTLTSVGDGAYHYAFGTPLDGVAPDLTHRLLIRIEGTSAAGHVLPATAVTYDWQPSTGATGGLRERDIVESASCNECHTRLAPHGGAYQDTRACVVCHNPGSTDAHSGNTLDFGVMTHRIHRGRGLPSVKAGGRYDLWGELDRKFEFGGVSYPQDVRNCTKCHDAADAATPQAGNWESLPGRAACGACHDDVNFETGTGHGSPAIAAADGECTQCHSEAAGQSVAQAHRSPRLDEAAKYRFRIVAVTIEPDPSAATAGFPAVTYAVTDPTREDAPYDLVADDDPADPPWAGSAIASRLRIDIGWEAPDYHNQGNADDSGRPADALWLNGLAARHRYNARPVDNGDGTYTVTSQVGIPVGVGVIAVALEGHPLALTPDPALPWPEHVPVRSVVAYAAVVAGATHTPRREIVDIALCNRCHEQVTQHGNSRTDEPAACVICHNANNTDIAWRPGNAADAPDGLKEQALDFKVLIHGIHAAGLREQPLTVFGVHGVVNNYYPDTVRFPGLSANCGACHRPDTFVVPLAAAVLGTTVDTGLVRANADDDLNMTATAAACSSCHDSNAARDHMELSGASFDRTENERTFETCAICHAPGRMFDVAARHALRLPTETSTVAASPAPQPAQPANWSGWCRQCHDPAVLAPARTVTSARTWMRQVGTGFGIWVTRGSHGEADMERCLDCHRPQPAADGSMPCNFCHRYGGQEQRHQWAQKFAYPPGVDPTRPEDCDVSCHRWVNTGDDAFDVAAPGFLNSSGDPEQTTYHGPVRPGFLASHGDKIHNTRFAATDGTGGCAFCHNRGADKTWHGREPVDPANRDGAYKTTIPNCVDCHNFDWGNASEVNLHSTHASLVGAEMPLTYPDGFNRGVQSCNLCHGGEEGGAACWNCHLSAHYPQVPYWKLPQ